MILHESAETGHRKINGRVPGRLPKLIGIFCEEVSERAKEIHTVEAGGYTGSQSDAIYSSAHFPKMFAPRAAVRIGDLIVIFATLTVPRIRPPECHESGNVNLGTKKCVCAPDGMACGNLETQVAHGL